MKKYLFILLLMLFSIVSLHVNASDLKTGTFTFGKGKKAYLFLPENFQAGKPYKFIMFLHGRGSAAGTPGNFGTPEFAKFRKLCSDNGFIVAVPPLVATWFNAKAEKDIDEMLSFLSAKLKINLSRFHVIGCSMGGMAALVYAGRNAERVISITDFFGPTDLPSFSQGQYKESIKAAYGGYYDQKKPFYESRNPLNYVGVLKNIPMMIIHGGTDTLVKPEQSQKLYEAIKKAGGKQAELIIVPKVWHANKIVNGREEKIIAFIQKNK
ncbi:MAG: hypothetical protein E7052_10070 [Lentisphaerae bacterium]|nr:hypothetical protein [Lentisphaerota bacterium]